MQDDSNTQFALRTGFKQENLVSNCTRSLIGDPFQDKLVRSSSLYLFPIDPFQVGLVGALVTF